MKPDYLLFSDASVVHRGAYYAAGCGGVICDCVNQDIYYPYQYTPDQSLRKASVYMELVSMYQGLSYLHHAVTEEKKLKIVIFSDCKSIVDGFRNIKDGTWIFHRGHWVKRKNHKVVPGDQYYQKIFNLLDRHQDKVKVVHVLSHSNRSEKKLCENEIRIKQILKQEKIKGDEHLPLFVITMNRLADRFAASASPYYIKRYQETEGGVTEWQSGERDNAISERTNLPRRS